MGTTTNGTMTRRKANNDIFSFTKDVENMYKMIERELNRPMIMNYNVKETGKFIEKDEALFYLFPVPGCSKDDVSVELDGSVLSVEAEMEIHGTKYEFKNSFEILNSKYELDDIEVSIENGLLEIIIPNKKPTKLGKRKLM